MSRYNYIHEYNDKYEIVEKDVYKELLSRYLSAGKHSEVLEKYLRISGMDKKRYELLISNTLFQNSKEIDEYEQLYQAFEKVISCFGHNEQGEILEYKDVFREFAKAFSQKDNEYIFYNSFCKNAYEYIKEIICRPVEILRQYYEKMINDYTFDEWMILAGYKMLFEEYPLAFRLVCDVLKSSASNFYECIFRVKKDKDLIKEKIGINADQRITDLSAFLSDRHNGRTVIIVSFENGEKVVYKPRNMAIDELWQRIVDYYNEIDEEKVLLKAARTINCDEYGYMEYIDYSPRLDDNAMIEYFRACGAVLGLVSVLGGSDFHHENVIVSNERPYLIDVETLISPIANRQYATVESAEEMDEEVCNTNLIRTLLLTKWVGKTVDGAVNIGGFTGTNGGKKNFPLHNDGTPTHADEYESEIIDGFYGALNTILINRDGWIELLANVRPIYSRFVLRNTRVYYQLIRHFTNPVYLKNSSVYKCVLSRVYAPYLLSCTDEVCKKIWRMIETEEQSLTNYNIPIFMTKGDSTDLFNYAGETLVKDFFRKSPYDLVKNNILSLSQNAIMNQVDLLKRVFSLEREQRDNTFKMIWSYDDAKRAYSLREISDEEIDNEIEKIYDTLMSFLRDSKYPQFMAPVKDQLNGRYQIELLGNYFYGGNLGIYIFLLLYYDFRNCNEKKKWLEEYIYQYSRNLIDSASLLKFDDVSYTEGVAGLLQTIHYFYKITNSSVMRRCMIDIINQLYDSVSFAEAEETDFFNGLSGLLYVVSDICEDVNTDNGHIIINRLVDKIIDGANKELRLWIDESTDFNPILGWAHGQSGYAVALTKALRFLESDSQKNEVREYIESVLEYENRMYDGKAHNLPDYRKFSVKMRNVNPGEYVKRFMYGNCSGIIGTVQTMIMINKYYPVKNIDSWIERAKAFVENTELVGNDSLCCGTTAWIELLIELLQMGNYKDWADQWIRKIIVSRIDNGYIYNSFRSINDISLFKGESGVGYTLLRYLAHYPLAIL